MGDLDVCLIKEFARRPGFYDRSDPHFKDKTYVSQSWAEISHQLGYEANLLKDRMYQLRNRYNLEKRRLENLRMEDPTKQVRSPWPLFYHLTFLDGHIRPRRSYKSMMRRHIDTDRSGNEDDPLAIPEARESRNTHNMRHRATANHSNGSIDIKYEAEIDSEDDQRANNNDGTYLDPTNFLVQNLSRADDDSVGETSSQTRSVVNNSVNNAAPPPRRGAAQGNGINVRSLESLKRKPSTTSDDYDQPAQKKLNNNQVAALAAQNGYAFGNVGLINKFAAFGQFLAASLSDMEQKTAFDLIGKFTYEVLKAMQETKSSNVTC
ncbi:uncharacterized protein LOC119658997 isoform X1 [Hermetia illucens]|uniref:uncharacterized protein LOC119658997 isoform X1 n=1 Tax=Hermetia illucens TaxID=343691 RepID=UPI0018CC0DF2|nr:uncharacterized protein LOC119658997 isoform X1 [Hermetia illucens]XP_037922808.1 uncharacterized protein LOC119658997 isoform X1 [Hermetia illucens]XP_037922809.1 uncharacterized protein LOC119658997 isoform X1 [Hermetia illucens]